MNLFLFAFDELYKLIGRTPLRLALLAFLVVGLSALLLEPGSEERIAVGNLCLLSLRGIAYFYIPIIVLRTLGLIEFEQKGTRGYYQPTIRVYDPDWMDKPGLFGPTVQLVLFSLLLLLSASINSTITTRISELLADDAGEVRVYLVLRLFIHSVMIVYLCFPGFVALLLFGINCLGLFIQQQEWMASAATAAAIDAESKDDD